MPNANIFQHKHDLEGFTVDSKTITIANGATGLSNAIDLEGYILGALYMPAAWTTANITVLSAPTIDGTYEPVYYGGVEVTESVAAGQCVPISNVMAFASLRFIKLRSGTAGTPVNQGADRVITLGLKR